MKHNYIFLTSILLFFAIQSLSQANIYLQNDPEWQILTDTYSGTDCTGSRNQYNYSVNGDTIVNSLVYKKIYKKGIQSTWNVNCQLVNPTPYSNKSPSFCLRSFNKKMFILNSGKMNEELLYDFNLALGDTLPTSYTYNPSNHTYDMYVTKIDSIYTPFGYRKKFTLTGGRDTLYEGIGSTGGLDESVFRLFLSGSHNLICYSMNNVSYVPSVGRSCSVIVGIQPFKKEEYVSIFPNPFSDRATLQFNRQMKNAVIRIYNASGILAKTVIFSGTDFTLEREELNQGLYYYRVEAGGEDFLTGKLIILNPQ